jgi:hypothetical protein
MSVEGLRQRRSNIRLHKAISRARIHASERALDSILLFCHERFLQGGTQERLGCIASSILSVLTIK